MNYSLTPDYPSLLGETKYYEYKIRLDDDSDLDDDQEIRYPLVVYYSKKGATTWTTHWSNPYQVSWRCTKTKVKLGWFSSKMIWNQTQIDLVKQTLDLLTLHLEELEDAEDLRRVSFDHLVADLLPAPIAE